MGAKENTGARNTREALILAGLEELNEYGIQHFSTRRVAKACGMSCAAPYKHFKDSHEFIAAISIGSTTRSRRCCWKSASMTAHGSSWCR